METKLYTFKDIFSAEFDSSDGKIKIDKVIIPIIQRDYAQGRRNAEVDRVRSRFLDSLYSAVTEKGIILDFIYGNVKEGILTPLDGQQRLTTLFLLHWYAAKKDGIDPQEYLFLKRFSYETRYSARDFCEYLIDYTPDCTSVLSSQIVNEAWFPYEWMKDQTISAMLVMIDAIKDKFGKLEKLWDRLTGDAIRFYFLPLDSMNLTDELYIKMNSRGKPLTPFEHFKAELEKRLTEIDPEIARVIGRKIDLAWSDMLWEYRGDNNIIDDEFLRYFKFICDVICYKEGGTTQNRSYDDFDLLDLYFSKSDENILNHIDTMEKLFDCWCDLPDGKTPSQFLEGYISKEHMAGKIKIDNRFSVDIFSDCLNRYAEISGRNRLFPLNRFILLYAIVVYLTHQNEIAEDLFIRRLRIINNLIMNSEFEISDSPDRTSGNRMPGILDQVDRIMIEGVIEPSGEKGFNINQLNEEIEKVNWLQDHSEMAESLFELEDQDMLYGQISIIGLENVEVFPRFARLFSCNLDKVDCALMALGFYGQQEQARWRYQLGTGSVRNVSAWHSLFHKSRNQGFEETGRILVNLLKEEEYPDDQFLDQIADMYLKECEEKHLYDWRYYYIRYKEFRPGSYGKYGNSLFSEAPYRTMVMTTQTKISEYSYNPFLMIVAPKYISREHYGSRIVFSDCYIKCENDHYAVFDKETDEERERISITQDEHGIDTEDRTVVLNCYLDENGLL